MRNEDDIQKAHDSLVPIILGEVDFAADAELRHAVHLACDVLCWVLQHDHNNTFADNLEKLGCLAKERGYALKRIQ